MDVFDLAAKITLDDSGYKSGLNKAKKAFGTAAKVIGAGVAAASGAVVALTKQAVNGYKEYEQLVGGVETLFGAGGKSLAEYAESAGKTAGEVWREYSKLQAAQSEVMRNAEQAYETAGLSANEYMTTVTSFSASLIQSVGGDTVRAAQLADQAIVDMSDNANKMGSSMESIQTAYQGFAKQNYTMLDNLKLGYGGTKTEMERLVADAEKLNSSFKAQRDASGKLTLSYADVVEAIHIVQDEMGITGTTAREASETIEGSLNMTKAAWANLVAGLSDPKADLGKLMNNFTKSAKTAARNIVPAVRQALKGIGTAVRELAPIIGQELPGLISDLLPGVLDAATSLVSSLVAGLPGILKSLIGAVPGIVRQLASALSRAWKSIEWDDVMDTGKNLLTSIGEGVKTAVGNIREWVTSIVGKLGSFISEHWGEIQEKGSEILSAIGSGLKGAISKVGTWITSIATFLGTYLTENWGKITEKGSNILTAIGEGVSGALSAISDWITDIATNIGTYVTQNWDKIKEKGSDILTAVGEGVSGAFSKVEAWVTGIRDKVKEYVDTHWDEFKEKGSDILSAVGAGLKGAIGKVENWVETIAEFVAQYANGNENWEKFKASGSNIMSAIGAGFKGASSKVQSWITTISTFISTYISGGWDTIKEKGRNILSAIGDGVKEAAADAGKWIGDIIGKFAEWLREREGGGEDSPNEIGSKIIEAIGKGIVAAVKAVGTVAGWVAEVIGEFNHQIGQHSSDLWYIGTTILKKIGIGILQAFMQIVVWMGAIVEKMSGWIDENVAKIKKIGEDIVGKIGEGIASMWETVKGWAGQIFNKVVEGAGTAWDTITGIGESIVSNIKQGIINAWDSFVTWIGNMLRSIPGVSLLLGGGGGAKGSDLPQLEISQNWKNATVTGHHANGMDYVPANGYPAILHRGEAVLTRQEADAWRSGKSGGGMTVNIYAQEVTQSTVDYIIARADAELGGLLA